MSRFSSVDLSPVARPAPQAGSAPLRTVANSFIGRVGVAHSNVCWRSPGLFFNHSLNFPAE